MGYIRDPYDVNKYFAAFLVMFHCHHAEWRSLRILCLGYSSRQYLSIFSVRQHATAPASPPAPPTPLPAHWLSDLKSRLGKCILFGLNAQQIEKAGRVAKTLAIEWRELVAGSEGFLIGRSRRGLYRQEVVWGEMVGVFLTVAIDCTMWEFVICLKLTWTKRADLRMFEDEL